MYAGARRAAPADPRRALAEFRTTRDHLFATHPASPIPAADQPAFRALPCWPYDPALRFVAEVEPADDRRRLVLPMSRDEPVPADVIGRVRLPVGTLDVYWLAVYGGGVFLPFTDATSGAATYGGGRYLLDTIKGADLGGDHGRLVVDFNYAYHPSCYYDASWSCPLAPAGNRLPVAIEAGERGR